MDPLSPFRIMLQKATKLSFVLVVIASSFNNLLADEVDELIHTQMQLRKIPGLQIAVLKNNVIVKTASYGIANLQDSVSVTNETLFTINSMTKSFVGVAIMQLVEQGKLKLSDNISKYLEDIPADWANISIKQLLSHTSGLPDIMGNGVYMISAKDADSAWQNITQQALDFKANTQFRYNQTNYALLGKIINKISGINFSDFISQHQLLESKMNKTAAAGFAHFQDVIPNQARGYTYDLTGALTNVYSEFPSYLRATAGMSSNANELAKWILALQNGQLLKNTASLKTLWTPSLLEDGKMVGFDQFLNGYALGWQVIERENHPAIASVGGNRAAILIYPKDKLVIVVLTNLMGASPELFIDEIAGLYIPTMQSINGIRLTKEQLEPLVGEYEFNGFSITVSLEGNSLAMLASGKDQEKFSIYAESSTSFFAKLINANFVFQRDELGQINGLIMQQGDTKLSATKTK